MMQNKPTLTERITRRYPRKENGRTYLGTGVASVLIALIVLVIACFAALTYISADSKMELSQKSKTYCDNYYAAESEAADLLDKIARGKAKPAEINGVKAVYETDAGNIDVTQKGSYVSFRIAVNKKQELQVEADVENKKVRILTWAVE